MIQALIIDDEKPSREVIFNYLEEYCKDVKVLAFASSVKTAYKAITKYSPELIFLDVELGDGTGFNLLSKFEKIDFKIIFTTAYSEYALNAFRVNAVDYLLKPVKIGELKAAIEKVRTESNQVQIINLIKNLSDQNSLEPTLLIQNIKGFEVLKVNEIIMCQADGYCTNFTLTGMRKVVSSKNLKHFEAFLSGHNFIRVHHSYIVSLNHVCSYSRQGELLLSEGNKAYVSFSKSRIFFTTISKNKNS